MLRSEIELLRDALQDDDYHVFWLDYHGSYHIVVKLEGYMVYFMGGFMLNAGQLQLSEFKKGVLIPL